MEQIDKRVENVTREEVEQIVSQALRSIRIYVVESDITAAQQSVAEIVEQATF